MQFTVHGAGSVIQAIHRLGEMPLPPYITRPVDDPEQYQTVYGVEERSVASRVGA